MDLVVLLSLHVYFSILSLEKAANTSLTLRLCLSLADSLFFFFFLSVLSKARLRLEFIVR